MPDTTKKSNFPRYCLERYGGWRTRYGLLVSSAVVVECQRLIELLEEHDNRINNRTVTGMGLRLSSSYSGSGWIGGQTGIRAYGWLNYSLQHRSRLNWVFSRLKLTSTIKHGVCYGEKFGEIKSISVRRVILKYASSPHESSDQIRLNILCTLQVICLFNEWVASIKESC